MSGRLSALKWRWYESAGYWWYRRITHRWGCGGTFTAFDGGCSRCDLMPRRSR